MHENHHRGKYKNQHHNWPQPFGGVCAYQYAMVFEQTMAQVKPLSNSYIWCKHMIWFIWMDNIKV